MTGAIVRNKPGGITVELPTGEIAPAATIDEAFDLIESHRNAGPQIACADCDPETCPCVPR